MLLTLPFAAAVLVLFLVLFLTIVVYEESSGFRYKFKFCLYVVYVSGASCALIPYYLWRGRGVGNTGATCPLVKLASPLLGIQWEIRGAEHIAAGPYVIICNHQSILDVLGMAHIWPHLPSGCAVVAKKEILYVLPFGLSAYLCGTVFIDRASPNAKERINAECQRLKRDGASLWLFPEGTRSKGRTLLPFKKGAFVIAKENGMGVLPIVMSPYTFINDEQRVFDAGKMLVTILPPIQIPPEADLNQVIESTRDSMIREYQLLAKKVHLINSSGRQQQRNGGPVSYVTFGQ